MKVAIVHDYFHQYGGAEKVVEEWLEMYPEADIYTSFYVAEAFKSSPTIHSSLTSGKVKTSLAQRLFNSKKSLKYFKHCFWLYPVAMSLVEVADYDLVLISSTNPGKNIRLNNNKKVLHYCHTPTRYLYLLDRETDLKTVQPLFRMILPLFTWWLRYIDQRAARYLTRQGTQWIANSDFTAQKIQNIYDVESTIIYPPVNIDRFKHVKKKVDTSDPFYFYFGRISFHKKTQLAIQACLESGRKLVVAGSAAFQPEMDKLTSMVDEHVKNHPEDKDLISFKGRLPYEDIEDYLSRCSGYIFPGIEDFGIIQIEVLASGTPVIGIKAGGHLEYITQGENGVFFDEQTPESIHKALQTAESISWNSDHIRASAETYSQEVFQNNIRKLAHD